MRWIKAEEETLPPKGKLVNGRFQKRPAIVCNSNLIKGYITVNGHLERIDEVEWLDETEANPISDEQIEAMAEKRFPRQHPNIMGCNESGFIEGAKAIRDKASNPLHNDGWVSIDYDKPPKGEVLLLTTSKSILKGDWYENNLVQGFGWRTERSQWAVEPSTLNQYLTLTPKEEITHFHQLPPINK